MTIENHDETQGKVAPEAPVTPEVTTPVAAPAGISTTVAFGSTPQVVQFVKGPTNPVGTGAGVTGIVGMALIMVPFIGGILCLIAAILGGVGISKASKEGLPKGMAITGLVLGIVGVAIYLAVTVLFAAASAAGAGA